MWHYKKEYELPVLLFYEKNLVLKQKKKIVSFDIAKRLFAVQTFGFFLSQDCFLKRSNPTKKSKRNQKDPFYFGTGSL